jgi:hypothetical protein
MLYSGTRTDWLVDWLADLRACWCGQGTPSRRYGARWSVIGWFTLVRALWHSCASWLALRVCREWRVVHTLSWVVVHTSHASIRDASHGVVKYNASRWCVCCRWKKNKIDSYITLQPESNNMIVTNPGLQIRGSIVVSISACHAEDPGSIPGRGGLHSPCDFCKITCVQRTTTNRVVGISVPIQYWYIHQPKYLYEHLRDSTVRVIHSIRVRTLCGVCCTSILTIM